MNLLRIDELGIIFEGDKKLMDLEFCSHLLSNLKRNENGSFSTHLNSVEYTIHCFDQPLIVYSVRKENDDKLLCRSSYGFEFSILLSNIKVDPWDRFHSRSMDEIPCVLLPEAQAEFFDLCDEYDDDSFTMNGKTFEVLPLMNSARVEGDWDDRYKNQDTGWDLGAPAVPIMHMIKELKLLKSRILILGAGKGHEALALAEQGHSVTAVDISVTAGKEFFAKHGRINNLTWVTADFFKLPEDFYGQFDLFIEHTCFCAVDYVDREKLTKVWKRCLAPRGALLGLFFIMDKESGPPFGATEWEIRQRLKKDYRILYWHRPTNSHPARAGRELIVYAERII